jgi:2-aminoethylphosphonate-pyruvate transaminase
MDADIPYLLLTPGPLTTSRTVRQAMQHDSCTWDRDYTDRVHDIRRRLVALASDGDAYTAVLMQGSGTFAVEATIGSVVPPEGKIAVVNNGASGQRMVQIARRLRMAHVEIEFPETEPADPKRIERVLREHPDTTHIALVHSETTTGLLNPAGAVGRLAARLGKTFIVDAMSSFGGIPFTMEELGAHFLVSSANKCIQGVPGFGFVIAERERLARTKGWARSLSLDLHDQWREMEEKDGKWRFTSPTHVVHAFAQALDELRAEGGVSARHRRYQTNHDTLVNGMAALGFRELLPRILQSPIITAFHYPDSPSFSFETFYAALKKRRFVIYPGKVGRASTFRIGTIGHVFPNDIQAFIQSVAEVVAELGLAMDNPAGSSGTCGLRDSE